MIKYKINIIVLSFSLLPLFLYSQNEYDKIETKKLLTVFINDFSQNILLTKPKEICVLNQTNYKLHPLFLSRLRASMHKYVHRSAPADSLTNMSYLLNKSYKKFVGVLNQEDSNDLSAYETTNSIFNYQFLASIESVKLLDSNAFFKDYDLSRDFLLQPKISLKGPFINQSKNLALLEVIHYSNGNNTELMLLVYTKKEEEWKFLGNVTR
jgi:hypothetical protein